MNNFEHATKATNTALESQGSANEENARYMESLTSHIKALQNAFQDLSRAVLSSEFLSGLLDVLTQIVRVLADNPWIVQIGLMTAGLTSIGALSKNFLPILGALTSGFGGLAAGTAGATAGLGGFAAVLGSVAPYALVASAAIAGLIALFKVWKEEHPDLKTMNEQLQQNTDRLEALNRIPYASRTQEIQDEIDKLEAENSKLEKNIELKKQAQEEADNQPEKPIDYNQGVWFTEQGQYKKQQVTAKYNAQRFTADNVDELLEKIKKANPELEKFDGTLEDLGVAVTKTFDGFTNVPENLQKNIDAVERYNRMQEHGIELNDEQQQKYQAAIGVLSDYNSHVQDAKDTGQQLNQTWYDLSDSATAALDKASNFTDVVYNQADAFDDLKHGAVITQESYDGLIAKYPELENYMTIVNGSIEEGNALWGVNVNALSSAAAAGNSWAKAMIDDILAVAKAQVELNRASSEWKTAQKNNDYSPSSTQIQFKGLQYSMSDYNQMIKAIESYKNIVGGNGVGKVNLTGGGGGDSSKSKSSEKSTKDEDKRLKLLQSIVSLRKSEADLTAEQTDDADKLVAKYKSVQSALHDQANYMRSNLAQMKKQGASQQEINAYQESIVSLSKEWYSWESKIKNVLQEQAKAKKEAYKESLNAQKDALEAEQDELNLIAKYAQHVADEQIDKIQEQIDAIDKVNDALDDQIEKQQLLEALAQAKQKRLYVYKDGRFQYIEDVDAVTEAQQNLDEFNRKQLDKEKKEALEAEKKRWEEYKDGWSNLTDSYDYEQGELLYLQKYGTRIEKQNWDERLQNLDDFVREYRAKVKELEEIQNALNNIEQNPELPSTGGNTTATTPDGKTINVRYDENGKVVSNVPIGTIIHTAGGDYQVTGGTPGNYTSVKVPSGTSADTQVGGGGGSNGFTGNMKATLPDGTTKDVHYENGKLTTDLPAGSIIHTSGGDYTYPGKSGGGSSSSGSSSSSKGSSSSSSSSSGSYTAGSSSGNTYNIGSSKGRDFVDNAKPGSTMKGADGSTWTKNSDGSVTISKGGESYKVRGYAGGTMGAFGGMAMVGEQGPELRVLNKGDGILPADITRNLFKIGSDPSLLQNKTTNQSTHINVSNITLPNVTDAKSFIDGIKSMAIQRAYAR